MRVLIIGATSAIAHETAKCFAGDGADLFLVARNAEKLQAIADDLKVRGARSVQTYVLDLAELERHEEMLNAAIEVLQGLDRLLIAHGTLGNQRKSELSVEETLKELNNNLMSVISLLTLSANYFEQQKRGCIAVISSVAGDRGRQSNYLYGSAKGGLTVFLQGLRNRLHHSGVDVITVKPGFVDTRMVFGKAKLPLVATPERVARDIYTAIKKRKNVVYVPWFWQF